MTDTSVFASTGAGGIAIAHASATETIEALERAGWRVALLTAIADLDDFHTGIAAELDFGEYYGRNLDALWDCLTDLPGPVAVVWQQWTQLALEQPQQWGRLLPVLKERTAVRPAFALVLA
ncbi:barstar family protein [Propionibacteriaceae bacterium Y1685]|uniref:barstar family protein n=1 Tax=Microlunatus sp. Y1700 TaxID=3418487 RepID=UPI003B77FF52